MARYLFSVLIWIGLSSLAVSAPVALIPDGIIDGVRDNTLIDHAVIVDGDSIVAIPPATALPPNLETLPMPGMTLLPGLINGHEHPLISLNRFLNLIKEIIDLIFCWSNNELRIKESSRSVHLFHHNALTESKLAL